MKHASWRTVAAVLLVALISQTVFTGRSYAAEMPGAAQDFPTPPAVCAPAAPLTATYLPLIHGPASAAAPAPQTRALAYTVGATYVYKYQMQNDTLAGKLDSAGLREDSPNTSLVMGRAEVSITGMDGPQTFVGQIRLVDAVVCRQNEAEPDTFVDEADFVNDLQTPLFFKQHAGGTIVEVQSDPGVQPAAANLLKGILNTLQITLQAGSVYTATESGSQGTALAHYTAKQLTDGLLLTKTLGEDDFQTFLTQGSLPGLALENTVQAVLERSRGVFNHLHFHEVIRTENAAALNALDFDGAAVWNTAETSGSLSLLEVIDNPPALAAVDLAAYQADSLGAVFEALPEDVTGINVDELDMDAELDALEANPADQALFQRLALILDADDSGVFSAKLQARLLNHLDHGPIARAYIDLLGSDGSPAAQAALSGLVDPFSGTTPISTTLQEQIMLNLALVRDPQPAAVDTLTAIMGNAADPERAGMATLALGSVAYELTRTLPVSATLIYDTLVTKLNAAGTEEEIELLLSALGNTGNGGVLGAVNPYFHHSSPRVQWAAYYALNKAPGAAVETILIGALEDETLSPFVQQGAAAALKNRPGGISLAGVAALEAFYGILPFPQGGLFQKTWTKNFGGQYVGGSTPGQAIFASPPYVSGLEIQVSQDVNFYLNVPQFNLSVQKQAASAQAWTKPVNPTTQQFGYKLVVFGQVLNNYVGTVSCADSKSGTIYDSTRQGWTFNYQYPVYGALIIGVSLNTTGHFKLDYSYNWNVCNTNNMSGQVNITPLATPRAVASAYAQITLVRGGVSLTADILKTTMPAALTATFSLANDFQACANIPLQIQSLSGYMSVWAEVRSLGKWKRVLEKTLWTYGLPASNYTLLNQCWTP